LQELVALRREVGFRCGDEKGAKNLT